MGDPAWVPPGAPAIKGMTKWPHSDESCHSRKIGSTTPKRVNFQEHATNTIATEMISIAVPQKHAIA
eukprot:946511-Amphidinium_carterae.1